MLSSTMTCALNNDEHAIMQAMQLATVAAVMPLNQRRMNLPMRCERQLRSCKRQHIASMRRLTS